MIQDLRAEIAALGKKRNWIDDTVITKIDDGQPFYLRGRRWAPAEPVRLAGQYSIEGIPDHVIRVRSAEDHDEVFTRVQNGIYKGLWTNYRRGGYYDDVELLVLTDVEEF